MVGENNFVNVVCIGGSLSIPSIIYPAKGHTGNIPRDQRPALIAVSVAKSGLEDSHTAPGRPKQLRAHEQELFTTWCYAGERTLSPTPQKIGTVVIMDDVELFTR